MAGYCVLFILAFTLSQRVPYDQSVSASYDTILGPKKMVHTFRLLRLRGIDFAKEAVALVQGLV